jgi:hypothetical protein
MGSTLVRICGSLWFCLISTKDTPYIVNVQDALVCDCNFVRDSTSRIVWRGVSVETAGKVQV